MLFMCNIIMVGKLNGSHTILHQPLLETSHVYISFLHHHKTRNFRKNKQKSFMIYMYNVISHAVLR